MLPKHRELSALERYSICVNLLSQNFTLAPKTAVAQKIDEL